LTDFFVPAPERRGRHALVERVVHEDRAQERGDVEAGVEARRRDDRVRDRCDGFGCAKYSRRRWAVRRATVFFPAPSRWAKMMSTTASISASPSPFTVNERPADPKPPVDR
jgi:hypothetical protein